MLAWFGGHVGVTEVVLIVGVVVYIVDRVVDAMGWSRTSKTLRSENIDLVRRNTELEEKVTRMEGILNEQAVQILAMEARITELQARDQLAVIQRLDSHEVHAGERHTMTLEVLKSIATSLERR